MRALVVIPTYQEAENIDDVLRRVRSAAPDAHVLVVDDGSPDGTADLAERAGRELGQVAVLRRAGKAGLGSAYRDGFRWGLEQGARVLVEMDADLSHDPDTVPVLIAGAEAGIDLVVGSRYTEGGAVPGWPRSRRLLSQVGNRYAGLMLGMDLADATAGFRAYRAEILEKIDLDEIRADGYGFQIEMAYAVDRHGGTIAERPITFRDRARGTSKMSWRIVAEAMVLVTRWGVRDRIEGRRHRDEGAAEVHHGRTRVHHDRSGRDRLRDVDVREARVDRDLGVEPEPVPEP